MTFYKSEATTEPIPLDFGSSETTVFIRRNIVKTEKQDPETGESTPIYQYDEARIPKTEYIAELHSRQEETDEVLQDLILATFGGEP